MQDIGEFFSSYLSKLVFDPNRLEQVQERLSLINKLKKKYGATIKDILAYRETAQSELDSLGESEQDKTALEKEVPALEAKLFTAGTALSQKRKGASAEDSNDPHPPRYAQSGIYRASYGSRTERK